MINVGYIEATRGDVVVRVYYDTAPPAGPSQPLVNGPRGYCLDATNMTDRNVTIMVNGLLNQVLSLDLAKLAIGGSPSGQSRTLAQMTAAGFTTRGSIGNFQIG